MSRERVQQARAALQADPTQAQHWVGYVQALLDAGQLAEADKTIAVAAHKGLAEPVLHDLARRRAQTQQPTLDIHPAPPARANPAVPSQQEINRLAELFQAQRFAELVPRAQHMTTDYPTFAFGWSVLGAALTELGRHAEALNPAQRAAALAPQDARLHYNLGKTLNLLKRYHDAETGLSHALRLDETLAPAHYQLGLSLHAQGQIQRAETCYRRVLQLDPRDAQAYNNLGITLADQSRQDEAQACFWQAIELDPQFADAHSNMVSTLHSQGKLDEALARCHEALRIDPRHAGAYNTLGLIRMTQGEHAAAKEAFERAIALTPDFVEAHTNRGNALLWLDLFEEAEQCHRRALALAPDHLISRSNLGLTLAAMGRVEEAVDDLNFALGRNIEDAKTHANLLFSLNYHPEHSAEEIFAAYQAYDAQFCAPLRARWSPHANAPLSSTGTSSPPRRLRIGYVSPDLRQHSVRHFLEPLLACHDRSRFEIFAYAQLAREDVATQRYRAYCDHFILTRGMSDEALAARIRADAIDVLVDVAGHTAGNRLLTFARKPAPVSLSWMGYGYTTGLKAIDYLLTDEASAPAGSEHLFSEAPWRLPGGAYVFRPDSTTGEISPLPALSNGFVTFGTLSRAIRINHRTVRVWAEILKRVPGSRLVIDSGNFRHASMQDAMAERFAQHGIARERLLIGCHSPPWDTLRSMDIGLDCFPHNSGTTLFESLFMGVPFVTLAGRPSVGRLGKSILSSLGHPQWMDAWCAHSEVDYIDKAVALASDLSALQRIRSDLRPQMQHSALMDEAAFARRVENAYGQMFERWREEHV